MIYSKILQKNKNIVAQSKTSNIIPIQNLQNLKEPKNKVGLGFTVENEVFVGRIAMIGVASSLVGEALYSKGPIAQFSSEINLPPEQITLLFSCIAIFNLINGLAPWSLTYDEYQQNKTSKRPPGPIQNPNITIFDKEFYGISGNFGFTKENELFVGRIAQIGFASTLFFENLTGQGPLTYFDMKTGIPLSDSEFIIFVSIIFSLFGAIGSSYKTPKNIK